MAAEGAALAAGDGANGSAGAEEDPKASNVLVGADAAAAGRAAGAADGRLDTCLLGASTGASSTTLGLLDPGRGFSWKSSYRTPSIEKT